jgi:glucose-1-phosphate thymidylyltransferase
MEIVGLIPAGGQATRLAPLPCSKELYPVGFHAINGEGSVRPKPVCMYLLEKMRAAGVTRAYIVLRKSKWDIPAYLGDGSILNMHLAYLMMRSPLGVPYTLDQAQLFLQNVLVAFGFPDILFGPDDAFTQLLARQQETSADVVLGIFPAHRPRETDMVEVDDSGQVRSLVIKPFQTQLRYAWIVAVWSTAFTNFMHEFLVKLQDNGQAIPNNSLKQRELSMGDIIIAAIGGGVSVNAVTFPNNSFLDIGTPDDLFNAVRDIK